MYLQHTHTQSESLSMEPQPLNFGKSPGCLKLEHPCSPHLKRDPWHSSQPWGFPEKTASGCPQRAASLSGGPVSSHRWCGVCSQPRALSSRLYPETLPRPPQKSTAHQLLLAFPLKSFPWLVKRERNLHFKADKPLTPSAVPGSSQLLAEDSPPPFFFFIQTQERLYFWVLYTHFVYTRQIPVD